MKKIKALKKTNALKKINNAFRILATLIICTAVCSPAWSQTPKPRVSPPESVSGKVNAATISIHYSSPSVKGRKIWGGLVPYDSVWRAGANEATTFETDTDIKIAHEILPAGKYSFFLIPSVKGKWIAIFNKVPIQWGAFKYDKTKDQLRVKVKTTSLQEEKEMLNYTITSKGFLVNWDKQSVLIPVR